MRRAGRIIYNLATAASLLLCLAMILLWMRSLSAEDQIGQLTVAVRGDLITEHRSGVFSGDGRLAIGYGDLEESVKFYVKWPHPPVHDADRFGWDTTTSSWVYGEYDDEFPMGFAAYPTGHGVYSATPGYRSRGYFVSMPHWFVAMLFGLYPAWRVASAFKARTFSRRRLAMVYASLIGLVMLLFIFGVGIIWAVPVVIGIGIILAVRHQSSTRRIRDAASGLCVSCGYDLRATPVRCPECGAIPAKAVS